MKRTMLVCAALLVGACTQRAPVGGDAQNGRLLLRQFGCGECHRIPGVADAKGEVGPPLAGFGARMYVAGILPNSADNVARFIRDPQSVDPKTAMPNLQVGEAHARDMVAYLGGLR